MIIVSVCVRGDELEIQFGKLPLRWTIGSTTTIMEFSDGEEVYQMQDQGILVVQISFHN